MEVDINPIYLPCLIDGLAEPFPESMWEWQSSEITGSITESYLLPQIDPLMESNLTREKRGCVVYNLFETEHNYLIQLSIANNFFFSKLVERGILSEQSSALIFLGIAELETFHTTFYYQMAELLENWDPLVTEIGGLFIEHVEAFSNLYTRFIDNYAVSQKSIKKEEKENLQYNEFMKECMKMKETQRQSLKDFLIYPVQRTTRYHLLLKDLLKATSRDHPDYKDLEDAWLVMQDLATAVNDKKRQEEEATGLFDAFEQTKHCPPTLISHRRRLIYSCDAVCPKSHRSIRLVVCSDLLMITLATGRTKLSFSSSSNEYHYRFLRWIDLVDLDLIDLHESLPNTVRITLNQAKYSFSLTRPSLTTNAGDVPVIAKDVGLNLFNLQFFGFDALKQRTNFLNTIATVTKTNLAEIEESL